MSIYVNPSTEYEASAAGFPSGLVGTIGVRVVDGRGVTVTARTTAGIIEHPEGSGIYTKVLVSPSVPGQYQIIWDSGGSDVSWAVEELVVQTVTTPQYIPDGTARTTLADIIARVRMMLDDVNCNAFTDREIQDALDNRSESTHYYPLDEEPTIAPGGVTTYLQFEAPVGAWEEGYELVDSAYFPLTPESADPWRGEWEFEEPPSRPVMLTGTTHDVWGAAGDLMMILSGREFRSFDIGADDLDLKRSQKAEMLAKRAAEYRAKARTRSSRLVRTDEWV
jgi:hypothetical protein